MQIFAKIGRFSQKSAYFRKNLYIFAKICKFSQKSADFRKNRQIFAKIGKFSQKSANFRKNRQIFANICKFVIVEFSGSRPTSQFKNPKIFEFSRVRLKLHDSIKFRNPGFLHNRHVRRNRQIIPKISSMRKLLTNRVVPAQNFLAKIDKFSQKSASFRKNLQVFVKNSFFSQKTANFRKKTANFRKNRYIFAKICIFSQKSVNFSQKSANFRKNRQIFAKIGIFSQKSANFRKNR